MRSQQSMIRMLDIFDREATKWLHQVQDEFVASNRQFDDNFRQIFVQTSTDRLNASYSKFILESQLNLNFAEPAAEPASAAAPPPPPPPIDSDSVEHLPVFIDDDTDSLANASTLNDEIPPEILVTVETESLITEMEKEEEVIHDNDADNDMVDFNSITNFSDDNEHRVEASISRTATENLNADEDNAAFEETTDMKPAVLHVLRECHNRKHGRKKKQPKAKRKRINAKAKRFKCDQCEYTSYFQSRIKRHAQKHSTEKPFQCEECDVRFGYAHNLKTHLLHIHNIIYL